MSLKLSLKAEEQINFILAPLYAVNCPECLIEHVRLRVKKYLKQPPKNVNTIRRASNAIAVPVLRAVHSAAIQSMKSNFLEVINLKNAS